MITGSSPATLRDRRPWLILAVGLLITAAVTLQVKSITQTGDGFFSAPYLVVWLTLAGGGVISLLLFSLVRSLLDTGARAEARARIMTRELRKSEEKISLILNTIGEAVCGIDLNGCCTFCNPAALLILGYRSQEEMLGKNLHELAHHSFPDGSPFPVENCSFFKTLTENRGYRVDDELFWRSDGSSFPVEYWSEPQLTEGRITGAVVTFKDITERVAAEKKLILSNREWRNTFDTIPDLIAIIDTDYRITRANAAMIAAMKVNGENIPGMTCYQKFHGADAPPDGCPHRLLLADGSEHRGAYYVERLKGWYQVTATPIFDEAGKLLGSVHVAHDITEARKIQVELRLKDQAKIESISRLAAGVAHELNSPLSFITSNLRVLTDYFDQIVRFDRFRQDLDDSDSSSANRDAVATRRVELEIDSILDDSVDLISATLGGAGRITKIIQGLKSYTRHSRPDVQENEAITLDRCLENALTNCYKELESVATIRKEYEPLPTVLGNQDQLHQVFLNLLLNAGQAIVGPGEIVLRSSHDELFVYASVSDTGAGIPEEIMDRIFDPFFTTKDVGKGTGLGLSISCEIVKKHNGELLVESVVGVGSTFTVKLPRTEVI